jgi:actin-related protein
MSEDAQALVTDNDPGICKAVLVGDDAPGAVSPSMIGRPKQNGWHR